MPKKGLGKGLKALIPEYDSVNQNSIDNQILITNIIPNKNQPRLDFSSINAKNALKDLTNSIKQNGVLQPITVREINDNKYELIAGERRWRASKAAGLKTIPCYIISIENDSEMLEFALVENLQRENLNPIEEAESYLLLKEKFQLSQSEIAKKVGKGRTTIANAMRLLKLPEIIKDSLKSGEIQAGHARAILKLSNNIEINNIFKKLKRENLSVRQIEKITSMMLNNDNDILINKKTTNQITINNLKKYERKLANFFDAKIKIEQKNNKLIISFSNNTEFEQILNMIVKK